MRRRRRTSASRPSRCSWRRRGASTSGRASRTRSPHLGVVPVLAPVADDHPRLARSAARTSGKCSRDDRRHARPARDRDAARRRASSRSRKIAYGLAVHGHRRAAQRRAPGRVGRARRDARDADHGRAARSRRVRAAHGRRRRSRSRSATRITRESPELAEGHLLLARVLNRLGRQDEAATSCARGARGRSAQRRAARCELATARAWCGDFSTRSRRGSTPCA